MSYAWLDGQPGVGPPCCGAKAVTCQLLASVPPLGATVLVTPGPRGGRPAATAVDPFVVPEGGFVGEMPRMVAVPELLLVMVTVAVIEPPGAVAVELDRAMVAVTAIVSPSQGGTVLHGE